MFTQKHPIPASAVAHGCISGALLAALAVGQAPAVWLEVTTRGGGAALTHDIARARTVLFDGETWEWNGSHWIPMRPTTRPTVSAARLAYDPARQRTLMVGGGAAAMEIWEWDGIDWARRASANPPPSRAGFAIAFDVARSRLVLFGGSGGTNCDLGDTWEWDGANWQRASPAVSPRSRTFHAMAYDATRQRVVLFGGFWGCNFLNTLTETWEWDGATWVLRTPTMSPGGRVDHAMAYDEGRRRLVMFGDYYSPSTQRWTYGQTWEWDGGNWAQRTPATKPASRIRHGMAYDSARGEVMLVGGTDQLSGAGSDTWTWNGATWRERAFGTPSGPQIAMVFDTSRNRVLVCPGYNQNQMGRVDVWEWDGAAFALRAAAVAPSERIRFALAFDTTRGRAVLFGGYNDTLSELDDTWEWDGAAWSTRALAIRPSARSRHAVAFDAARQRVVLFGGNGSTGNLADTWTWDGSTWTLHASSTSPSPRDNHAMAFDSTRQRVLLFGGYDGTNCLADTWEWTGMDWIQLQPAASPPARSNAAMAYDDSRRRMVLHGGTCRVSADTWEWDGTLWTQVTPNTGPSARNSHGMAYDAPRRQIVSVGGGPGLWRYGLLQPASAQTFGAACAGVAGPLTLLSNVPTLGSPALALDLHAARPNAPCVFGLAATSQNLAVGGGCSLYLQDPILPVFAVTTVVGFASVAFPVPTERSLRGLTLFAQAIVLDPQGAALGLAFSAGRRLVLGD